MSLKKPVAAFAAAAVFLSLTGLAPSAMAKSKASAMKMWDSDNDQTLDLAEIQKPAADRYDDFSSGHADGVARKDIGSRISKKEFKSADTDSDGKLTKDEFMSLVEQMFKAADPDNDGTLDAKELRTKAGNSLLRLTR